MEEIVTFWIAVSSLALGAIGTTLGVLSFWRMTDQDRLKLRVFSRCALASNGVETFDLISIDVINRSAFPVTITEVGFSRQGVAERVVLLPTTQIPGDRLPKRLEPRESASFFTEADKLGLKYQTTHVHARTACGETVMFRQKDLPGPGE